MPVSISLKASLALIGSAAAVQYLAPAQVINQPASATAKEPLKWLGANSPWYAGPNVFGISSDVPEGCTVDQVAYVVRHGSRYPDRGAYQGWLDFHARTSAGGYTSTGSLAFLPRWETVLSNPKLQIAMESPTGFKEAFDLGYQVRTRYPHLYNDGDDFMVWANNYTRVLQTAQMFVRGFLGWEADTAGSVIAVTSRGYPGALGNSLGPSDMCPNFQDTSGADQVAQWESVFVPPIQKRLQALISGNLTLSPGDITSIPYLCGFESQITGTLSPFCGIFTDEELLSYEYDNDLRYYYGVGPGADLPSKMMLPFLNSLVGLFQQGPNITGKAQDGSSFQVPKILMSFLNDGQLNEFVAGVGVFDNEKPLSPTSRNDDRLYIASHFTSMRGTVTVERLSCSGSGSGNGTAPTTTAKCRPRPTGAPRSSRKGGKKSSYIRIKLNDAVYPVPSCKSGPGSSCPLDDYVHYVQKKYAASGDWVKNCNVTLAGAPTTVQGASFFTDLSSPWLQRIKP
ncbi:uncharacterized protein E0L32_012056 [Thyridium curvatum]|uniref:3-phytase n=1 Tax=Thyridium curvatum TaxID=1093900 RepID=A0A507B3G1_9PEZI|nr:uncharacterized protein E0L32_012056 [Thyridium curvatum]TPX17645.1 hypothetical protein E0L32_012056 [Thyridium curvatum]